MKRNLAKLSEDLLHLICPEEDLLPVIIDQTAIGDVQVISANVPAEGRSISCQDDSRYYNKQKETDERDKRI